MNIQCDEKSHDIILRFRDRWAKHKKRRYLNKDDLTQDSNFRHNFGKGSNAKFFASNLFK